MTKLIFGVGIPGSGKTTALKDFASRYGYSYVCPDDIRQEITGDASNQSVNREVWQETYKRIGDYLGNNTTVVLDATFTNPEQRLQLIDFARNHGADKVHAIRFDTPLEVAKERNASRDRVVPEHVLDNMHRNLNKDLPSVDDDIDVVFTVDEYQKLVHAEKLSQDGKSEFRRDFRPR